MATQTELDALVKAWATGALTVEDNGRKVTYGSRGDLETRIAILSAALGIANPLAAQSSAAPSRVSYASFSRG